MIQRFPILQRRLAFQTGVSLLEVLIALLVFSVGVLGMAGLLIASIRTTHQSYLRTQAVFLAESLIDRVRANPRALAGGSYEGAYPVSGSDPCSGGTPCTPAQVAQRDRQVWSTQLSSQLPQAAATLACTNAGTPAATPTQTPLYRGSCTLRLRWTETAAGTGNDATTQTFSWVFQP